MAASAPAAFSNQQEESLSSTGPCIQAVSLTSLAESCRDSGPDVFLATLPLILQAKTNSWFNYESLSWDITEKCNDMELNWNSGHSLSRLRDTGIVGPWAK